MPDRIARLPRDKRGFPVPAISCWSEDAHGQDSVLQPEEVYLDLGPYAVQVLTATCTHVAGAGVPDLANLCAGKQVEMMTQRRCDVCADPIDGTCHFIGQIANGWFREAPLHEECATYSLRVCPGISTGEGVGVQSCATYDITPVFVMPTGNGTEEVPFESFMLAVATMQATQTPGVLIACHARPISPLTTTREEWLEMHPLVIA